MKRLCMISSFCLAASIALAQSPASRDSVLAEIEARQQQSAQAARVFADRSRPEQERAAAARGVDAFLSPEDVSAVSRVFLDRSESPLVRSLALSRIGHAIDRNPALLTEILSLAGSPQTPEVLRDQAAAALADLSFSSLSIRERSAEILPALRSLTRDPDEDLRRLAFGILAAHGDDFAQQRLIECLRSPGTSPLPPQECVRLLGLQLHGDAYPILHQILLRPPDEATRVEAIRLLGGYAESRQQLLGILNSRSESGAARMAALGTLHANDPEHFSAIALPVIRDESAAPELRIYGIQAVRHRRATAAREQRKLAEAAAFDDAVREVARTSKSEAVRRAALEYLRVLGLEGGQG
jgi:hypothetical protein